MERELWPALYQLVEQVGREVRQKGVQYQPWVIAAVVLWAALHDRSRAWACESKNWSSATPKHRLIQLPSASVLSRRADSVGMGLFWRRLEEVLRGTNYGGMISIVDGKPLFVGGCSKDPDAHWGYGAGMHGKGYKLHTIWRQPALPDAWELTPLNRYEATVAMEMVHEVDAGGYLLADGNYDTGALHIAARQHGYQLVAQDRRPHAGQGHRRLDETRRRSIELRRSSFGLELLSHRSEIERDYGQAGNFAGGLGPLPNWVRRQSRVRTWVWAKLLINAVRILRDKQLAA
jgi:hypothetical protein